ncbi:Uncharacterized protein HZ326_28597 [Fusarium oxysporum f. sp. albedinis]|nr:Uncharacterized protein HZ326_28597 [Fusarium oxysporum f. sp. albedinis]
MAVVLKLRMQFYFLLYRKPREPISEHPTVIVQRRGPACRVRPLHIHPNRQVQNNRDLRRAGVQEEPHCFLTRRPDRHSAGVTAETS